MKLRFSSKLVAATLCLALAASAAQAHDRDRYDEERALYEQEASRERLDRIEDRMAWLREHIRRASHTGELDRWEREGLIDEYRDIERRIDIARDDGYLSEREAQRIMRHQDGLRQRFEDERRD